jgi:hypothetical protein
MPRRRWTIVVVMIASLVLAGAARQWATTARQAASENPLFPLGTAGEGADQASLANMDSYALGLLLGGLRGPLVMFLWSTSESQKSSHNLEDFNTKIEWIRLLQPEFDTVHLYQIWNKAYNVSVQMANLPEKFGAILDAIDYADSVDRQRPDDINIIFTLASVFGNKLGDSHESGYYVQRVRQDTSAPRRQTLVTLPDSKLNDFMSAAHAAGMDQPNAAAESNDTSQTVTIKIDGAIADTLRPKFDSPDVVFRDLPMPKSSNVGNVQRDRMNQMLDESGNILPRFLQPTHPRPADWPQGQIWYDGSQLQFLTEYQPFRYGLTPHAIAFNYYKQAQALQSLAHEETLQTSNFVVDSRPALQLKFWGVEESETARRAELRLFGIDDTVDKTKLETTLLATDPDQVPASLPSSFADPAAGPRALEAYAMASRVFRDSAAELQDHLRRFPRNHDTFMSHYDDDLAYSAINAADHDFLDGLLNESRRVKAWSSAADKYNAAQRDFAVIILKYYIQEEIAMNVYPRDPATGKARDRLAIEQIPPDQYLPLMEKALKAVTDFSATHVDEYRSDRDDYLTYVRHAQARLKYMSR